MKRAFFVGSLFILTLGWVPKAGAQQPDAPSAWDNYYPPLWIRYGYPYGPTYVPPKRTYTFEPVQATSPARAFYYQPEEQSLPVRVDVKVPSSGAQVWFDGSATQQQGMSRSFESPPLVGGKTFSYQIRARWMDNGKAREETRTVRVRAGQEVTVDFTRR